MCQYTVVSLPSNHDPLVLSRDAPCHVVDVSVSF